MRSLNIQYETETTDHTWMTCLVCSDAWATRAAVEIAGVTEFTEDPDGSQTIRYSSGKPTGVLVYNALNLILLY